MTKLLKKGVRFQWNESAETAFVTLKKAFTQAPILAHFQEDAEVTLETDASAGAIGAVMSQRGSDGKLRPVAFMSKSLTPAERNYDVHDREMLAIVYACKIWRHYLEGPHPIRIFTDHKNLEYFRTEKLLSRRQARWSQLLNSLSYTLEYKPGVMNGKADALSRKEELLEESEPRQTETMLRPMNLSATAREIPPHLQINGTLPIPGEDLRRDLLQGYEADEVVKAILEKMEREPNEQGPYKKDGEGFLIYKGLLYVPDVESVRVRLMKYVHDGKLAGHYGRDKTEDLLSRDFYWPRMRDWVGNYVASCLTCQKNRRPRQKPIGELAPLPAARKPWSSITWDHITDLPESLGQDAILVIVDRFSKRAHFIPCRKDNNASYLAKLFFSHYVKLHGFPDQIISDRGTLFMSSFWRDVCAFAGVERRFSTAYHPETDGQTERSNSTLEQYLRSYVNFQQDDWAELLPLAEFAYNNSKHSAIGMSPFMASEGTDHKFTIRMAEVPNESADEFRERLSNIHESVLRALEQARVDMAKYANRKRRPVPDEGMEVGDQVMLSTDHIKTVRPNKKLDYKTLGPFKITEVVGDAKMARRLELPEQLRRVHPVFHVSMLIPYKRNELPSREQVPPPPPEVVDNGDTQWVVSEIVDSRSRKRGRQTRTQYLVRWEGYEDEYNEWVHPEDFHHDDQAVLDYHRRYPNKPKPAFEEYGDA
jgi:hypothetical protein